MPLLRPDAPILRFSHAQHFIFIRIVFCLLSFFLFWLGDLAILRVKLMAWFFMCCHLVRAAVAIKGQTTAISKLTSGFVFAFLGVAALFWGFAPAVILVVHITLISN